MMNTRNSFGLSVLLLGSALGVSAFAQTAPAPQNTDSTAASSSPSSMSPDDKSTYATGKPLEQQSKEGFWGHMNPLARKKWVNRQVSPIRDQVNELDQLQAKNANDIKDVDARAQAGIRNAQNTASMADQHAQDAANRANSAQTMASTATTRTDALGHTVGNLDQYQTVSATKIPFASGRTSLGPTAKSNLDALATTLAGEKGYIIEVQGYSRSGVQSSQAMADAVVRYLVTEHQVPVYRIYKTGVGRNTAPATGDEKTLTNGVEVTLLHNSLATMNSNASAANPAAPAAARTGVSTGQEVNQ